MTKLLSIVITVCNLERYVAQCVESLARQATDDCEIIIVDDGSTDRSPAICAEYARKFPSVIRHIPLPPPARLYRAHKAGMDAARGRYIQIVDGDDFIENGFVRETVGIIRNEAPDLIIGRFSNDVEQNALPLRDAPLEPEKIDGRPAADVLRYLGKMPNYHHAYWRYAFKRTLADASVFDSSLPAASRCPLLDAVVTYRLLFAASSFRLLDKPYYRYRCRADSVSSVRKLKSLAHMESFCEFLRFSRQTAARPEAYACILWKLRQELLLVYGKSDLWEDETWDSAALLLEEVREDLSVMEQDGAPQNLLHLRRWLTAQPAVRGVSLKAYFENLRRAFLDSVGAGGPKTVYLMPCGRLARDIHRWLCAAGFKNLMFLDNNPEMAGLTVQGSPCRLPACMAELSPRERLSSAVVIATIYEETDAALKQQCLQAGMPDSRVYLL